MRSLHSFLAAFCILLSASREACAWNDVGHMAAAKIAYARLSPTERAALHAAIKHHPHYAEYLSAFRPRGVDEAEWAFMRAAVWADWIRPPKDFQGDPSSHPRYKFHRGPWHYVNFAYNATQSGSMLGSQLPADTDILRQLQLTIDVLKDPAAADSGMIDGLTEKENRAVRICWLFHLIGDLHQPLHVTALVDAHRLPNGDQGGNMLAIRADAASQPARLHSVWDQLLGTDSRYDSVASIAKGLLDDPHLAPNALTELSAHRSFKDWAQEGYELAIAAVYLRGDLPIVLWDDFAGRRLPESAVPTLTAGDYKTAQTVARNRVALAGYRLAGLLQQIVP